MADKKTPAAPPKLPDGILKSDLKYPSFAERYRADDGSNVYEDSEFELWYTERFGWCIPCLLISRASRRSPGLADRFYAVTLNGESVRIGKGPHVLAQLKVFVRSARIDALKKFLDIRRAGSVKANEIRDTISTRRARGTLRRRDLW